MRLVIVSNRLPVTLIEKEGDYFLQPSVGGLATGIGTYLGVYQKQATMDCLWIGWPGMDVAESYRATLDEKLLNDYHSVAVYLSENEMEKFYLGFCNQTIWPLFHYFTSYAVLEEEFWEDYKRVNEIFCDSVLKNIQNDDIVWVHDYHLMLLPKLLREKRPDLKIGFFLHIPFPSFEIFRLLPMAWRKEILEGLLGADLIGFHTHDYTQAFLRCTIRILGYEHNFGQLIVQDRLVQADTFPMGIDFKRFSNSDTLPMVQQEIAFYQKSLNGQKAILSVDRLDYSKGILNRLEAYERFLSENPSWHGKVVLVLILVPSRTSLAQYQEMKTKIDEWIGKIQGRFGNVNWSPIIYQYRALSFETLAALYRICDVALVTPLRDGMNLIAKEYVASRSDETGVLILSEMAGASRELGEAIIINPTTSKEISESLKTALELPVEEQKSRNRIMQERLRQYDIVRWAEDFLQKLNEVQEEHKKLHAKMLTPARQEVLRQKFSKASDRLIVLDYDGTLVPFASRPEGAAPDERVLTLLQKLASECEVVIISGRGREGLDRWFGSLNVHLIAEHGIWIKEKREEWRLIKPLQNEWKGQILPILKVFADRLPGSFVEEKEYSLVWHYRRADPELASIRSRELMDDLVSFTANIDIQVMSGNKIIEVRNSGVSKGTAIFQFLARQNFDFILAIGDDPTDEDLFRNLPDWASSIRVGITPTYAQFNLFSFREVRQLLESL